MMRPNFGVVEPRTPRDLGECVWYTIDGRVFEAIVVGRCKPVGDCSWRYDVRVLMSRTVHSNIGEGALS